MSCGISGKREVPRAWQRRELPPPVHVCALRSAPLGDLPVSPALEGVSFFSQEQKVFWLGGGSSQRPGCFQLSF